MKDYRMLKSYGMTTESVTNWEDYGDYTYGISLNTTPQHTVSYVTVVLPRDIVPMQKGSLMPVYVRVH